MNKLILISLLWIFLSLTSVNAQSWKELMDSSKALQAKKEPKAAFELAEKALYIAEKQYGKSDTNYADNLFLLADLYDDMDNDEKAIEFGIQSLELNKKYFKTENMKIADINSSIAYWCEKQRNYEKAEPFFLEALVINRRFFKGDHPDLAGIIDYLANNYFARSNFKSAEPLYKEALEMRRRIFKGDNPELAKSINNLAFLFNAIADYDQAEPLYKEALEMKRRIYKNDEPDLGLSLNNMAYFYDSKGDYIKAEPYFNEALEMTRRIYKTDHPNLAVSLLNMAHFYIGINNLKLAEPLLKEGVDMSRRIYKIDNSKLADCLLMMASFYLSEGDYKMAESLFIESLEMTRRLFKHDHLDLARSIDKLGQFYSDRCNYSKAESLLKEALEMKRRILKNDHPDIVITLNNIANIYLLRDDFELAEPLFKEALQMSRRSYHGDQPNIATSINNLAVFFYKKGDYIQAEPLFLESLRMTRNIYKNDHPDLSNSISNIADFYDMKDDVNLAEPMFKEAMDSYKNMINNYFPSLSEKEKKHFWNTMSYKFERFNQFAVKRYIEKPLATCSMFDLQLYTKALLFNSTSKIKRRIQNSNDIELIEKNKELSSKKELLVKLYSMSDETRKTKGFNIDSIEKVSNDLEKELSLRSELYMQNYEKKKINWRSIQTILQPGEAAVEVVRFRYREKNKFTDSVCYAFLIVSDKTEDHPDLVVLENGNDLENMHYNNYRKMIKEKKNDSASFQIFWGKVYSKLKGYKKIYFSADGIYNKLNPATLLIPNGKYLLEEQDIQQVNSTKDIIIGYYQTKQESNIFNSAVLIGNPNFSLSESLVRESSKKIRDQKDEDYSYELMASTRGIELNRLPGTEQEIKDIEKFLKDKKWEVNSFVGDMALKTAVKTAKNPRVLHIATHGMFLEDVRLENKETFGFETQKVIDNPLLRSGLFFTGADNYLKSETDKPVGDENGLLTAYEAMNLDLDKTELVVLSACETGLGEIKNGEGVFGLRRAFQQAGAKTIIMSLWAVSDQATQELMSSFYKNWVSGMTKRDAFSKAQQEVRSKYKDPYYWGAFVMVGE